MGMQPHPPSLLSWMPVNAVSSPACQHSRRKEQMCASAGTQFLLLHRFGALGLSAVTHTPCGLFSPAAEVSSWKVGVGESERMQHWLSEFQICMKAGTPARA